MTKTSKNVFYMFVGLPGSGKSTYFKAMRDTYVNTARPFVYCSTDDVIEDRAKEKGKTYSEVFEDEIKMATKLVEANRDLAIKMEMDIIHDQTNLNPKKRKAWLDKIPSDWARICIVFQVPEHAEEEWKNRLTSRKGKHIPQHVIDQMEASYVEPTEDEGFDNVFFINSFEETA